MIAIGGKRLRPWLCLTAYSLYKDDFTPQILGPASALEVFHSFTLIHDDIIDASDTRRGNPTVHRAVEEKYAAVERETAELAAMQAAGVSPVGSGAVMWYASQFIAKPASSA